MSTPIPAINLDPEYAFKHDPTEAVKAAILSCFNEGRGWSIRQIVPHYVSPEQPGYKILLSIEWWAVDGVQTSAKYTETIEVQVSRLRPVREAR